MKPPMTQRQKDAFDFIREYIGARGISPTIGELATAIGLRSKSSVARIVSGLVERGALIRFPNRARGLAVAEHPGIRTAYLLLVEAKAKQMHCSSMDIIEFAILEYLTLHPLPPGETP